LACVCNQDSNKESKPISIHQVKHN
jgi:hypothetical protein